MEIVTLLSFTSPRLRGEVAARSHGDHAAGEGAFLQSRTIRQFPFTRLAPLALATLSPQAGRETKRNG
jgi:hypothetical protein